MYCATTVYLAEADPKLGKVIEVVGPCRMVPDRGRSPFRGLIQAVAHQQLNGKAANRILERFVGLFPHGGFPSAEEVLGRPTEDLLGAGFSRAKAACVQEIARQTLSGVVPSRNEIEGWPDDQIVERLTVIKGIGRWSVEMFLMFGLGRPDVLPIHDFGLRSGFRMVYRKRKLPDPEQISRHGEKWRPYRTTASWYLWRALEMKAGTPATW
jgi:3-methyladenine DNA glycosylase/8-oxoguanine DNA glycosylase